MQPFVGILSWDIQFEISENISVLHMFVFINNNYFDIFPNLCIVFRIQFFFKLY